MGADLEQVRMYLKNWANTDDSPHFAVLLSGNWGGGKTHFVKSTLDAAGFTERHLVYVSLFGISDTAALENQLFFASASKAAKIAHRSAGIFGSVVKGALRIDIDGDGKPDGTANIQFDGLSGMIQKAFDNLDGAVLVLDDVERSKIGVTDLLGVVNRLVEHGDTRVILVANRDKIKGKKFETFLEKVVGQSFLVSGDAGAVIDTIIAKMPDRPVKETFQKNRDSLLALHKRSGYGNLRAFKQFLWFLNGLLGKLSADYLKNDALLAKLLEQAFVFFVEFKLCLPGPTEKLAPNDLRSKFDTEGSGNRHVSDFFSFSERREKKKENPKAVALKKYELTDLTRSVLTVDQWVAILETGVVDSDWLNKDIAASIEVAGTADWASWKRLWHFHRWDFSDGSEDQFFKDIEDVQQAFEDGRYVHPTEFLVAASVYIMLIQDGVCDAPQAGAKAYLENYVQKHLMPNISYDLYRDFWFRFDAGFEGLGLVYEDVEEVKELRKFTKLKLEEWHKSWLAEGDAGQELLALLPDHWLSFLGNLTVINGESEQRFLDDPILQTIKPDQFADVWLSLEIDKERMLTKYMKDRYSRKLVLLEAEGPWWKEVQAVLEARAADSSVPRAVQIRKLIRSVEVAILKLAKQT